MASIQEKFLAAIDQQNGRFRIDKVTITTPMGVYRGAGVLDCGERIRLSVTLPRGKDIAMPATGIVPRKDFWKLKCVVEKQFGILIDSLPPSGERNFNNGFTTIVLKTNELEIEPEEWDKKTSTQIIKILEAHRAAHGGQPTKKIKSKQAKKGKSEVSFFAVVKNFKLMAFNKGTDIVETNDFLGTRSQSRSDTFMGILPGWTYGLIQAENDLHVHLRSDDSYVSQGKDRDRQHLNAFLNSIAFTHGQHARPSRLEYRCDHKMLTNQVRIIRDSSRTPFAPFSDRLWFSSKTGDLDWDFSDALRNSYEFFALNSGLSKEIQELLNLFRESEGSDVPIQIRLLTICSLYESLMRAIFAFQSHGKPKTLEILTFVEAKKKFVRALKKQRLKAKRLDADAISRLEAILGSASAESIREIVQIVSASLLKGTTFDWKAIHKEWSSCRNPLSHKISGQSGAKHDFGRDMLSISRIAGAVNVVILKVMGYSGVARISTYDDKYAKV